MGEVLTYGGIGLATARAQRPRGFAPHLAARDGARLDAAGELGEITVTAGDIANPDLFARATAGAGNCLSGLAYAVGTIDLRPQDAGRAMLRTKG